MAKTKTEIHVTTVFDGELDATDVFVSLIAQKYGQNTSKENLASIDVQLRTSEHRSMYSYVRLSIDRCTATYV